MTNRMSLVRVVAASTAIASVVLLSGCSDETAGAVALADASSAVVAVTATGVVAEPGAPAAPASRTGSGFVISTDGLIVTTNDVAVGADDVSVRVGDDDEAVPATLVGASECLDLAVLRIDGDQERPFLAWRRGAVGEGAMLHAGVAPATAGATPTNVDGTVTGILDPLVTAWAVTDRGVAHDVALPADGSGAALLDDEGRVAAVAHVGDDDLSDGSSDAIDAGDARQVVERIVSGDDGGLLGVSVRPWVDPEGVVSGIWVRAVAPDGPAADAGVQAGDVITMLGGQAMGTDGTLSAYCAALARADGAPVDMEVYRPGTDQVLAGQTGGPALPVVSTGEVRRSGAFATVADASGLVRVDVPVEWASVDGTGFTDAAGNAWYSLVAAPSAERFRIDRSAPGVQVAATGGGANVVDLLAALSTPYQQECTPLESVQQYDDGVYAGAYSRFSCDGTLAMVLSVRGSRGANIVVVAQVRSATDQQQTLGRILSTFDVG